MIPSSLPHTARSLLLSLPIVCFFYGCGPKIFSFDATPRTVTSADSVHLIWKVRGKPKLDFYQKKIANPPNDSTQLLEFILSAIKAGKQTAPRLIQVALVPAISSDRLVFTVNNRIGDTLVASGIKDSILWKGFEIISIASVSSRTMYVIHQGQQITLQDSGVALKSFQGLQYDGAWEIRTRMTPDEKKNISLIPERLQIKAIIQPKKH